MQIPSGGNGEWKAEEEEDKKRIGKFGERGGENGKGMRREGLKTRVKLEYGPMPNVMVALPNIGGAICSTPQSLADADYLTAVQ